MIDLHADPSVRTAGRQLPAEMAGAPAAELPPQSVHILHLEDKADDSLLVQHALRAGGMRCRFRVVGDRSELEAALEEGPYDVMLADYMVPGMTGLQALELARERLPGMPIVVVTGALADDAAVELLQHGALDYVLKDRLSRLPAAVRRACERATRERRVREAEDLARSAQAGLLASFEKTVEMLARAVEKRDPYTAGHQQRVACLAEAISREMGLDEAFTRGVRFGASIHDIGKLDIPSELLVRPGKLSPAALELIKSHVRAGWDIVKDVEFPWPVADMILQHHERLDGSGYPQGLRGDQIGLAGRILAVADVVEAMASFRPYRPALGIDAALAEVEGGRAIRFDPHVVDACVRLFRQRGFELPTQQ